MGKVFDNQIYQTGHTAPPKSRGGLIAALLAVIIILGGIISILGLMNIRLFRQLMSVGKESTALAVVKPGETGGQNIMEAARDQDQTVSLDPSPQSVENYPQEGGLSMQEIYTRTSESLVSVQTDKTTGTGIVLTENGYILTNSHVINGCDDIQICFTDGTALTAAVVGKDSFSDLAVLQVEAEGLVPAQFGDSTALRVGDAVVAIGNPLTEHTVGPMTDGIVSGITSDIEAGGSTLTLIQTNATPYSENVGGPLINCYGQIIGINTNCAGNVLSAEAVQNVNFALDSVTVKQIADQLIAQGFVSGRIHLGIRGQEIGQFYENYYDIPQGIFITSLDEDSALFERGVREGDILLELADTRILSFDTLNTLLSALTSGQEVTAVVYRDGVQQQITITIGDQ